MTRLELANDALVVCEMIWEQERHVDYRGSGRGEPEGRILAVVS